MAASMARVIARRSVKESGPSWPSRTRTATMTAKVLTAPIASPRQFCPRFSDNPRTISETFVLDSSAVPDLDRPRPAGLLLAPIV
jgi:hypothetical protein